MASAGLPSMLALEGSWDGLLQSPAREALGQDILPAFLRSQRWFGGKARQVKVARLVDHGALTVPGLPFCVLALFAVEFSDGKSDLYFVPLAVTLEDAAELVKLAEQLQDDLIKEDRHVLSIATLKKTEDIEKLARKIRTRLKK